jgi:hypothetical protein
LDFGSSHAPGCSTYQPAEDLNNNEALLTFVDVSEMGLEFGPCMSYATPQYSIIVNVAVKSAKEGLEARCEVTDRVSTRLAHAPSLPSFRTR